MTDYQWMSHMAAQTYPLADQVTGLSVTSQLLPKYLILDMRILVPEATGTVDGNAFYISRVQDQGASLSIYIGYNGIQVAVGSGIPKTLTMTQPAVQHWYTLTALQGGSLSWVSKLTGSICVGPTNTYDIGTQVYTASSTKLNRNVISVIGKLTYLQAIKVDQVYYDGIVQIQAGQGVSISATVEDQVTTLTISVDRTYVTQTVQQSVVQQLNASTGATPITSINGVTPDSSGNIQISGVDCVDVVAQGQGGLIVKNPCSKPCCDSTNMQSTVIALQALKQQQSVLQSYFTNQANTINYMQANLSTLMNQH